MKLFEGKKVTVLDAVAGAGKTTKMLELIETELQVRRPEEIAFVTFTRKGVEEGLRRACEKFVLEPDDLPYFRTIHSLSFQALGLKRDNIFNRIDERKFNREYGYYLNRCEVSNKVHPTKDSKYLDYYDMERARCLTSRQVKEADIEQEYYRTLVQKYEEYKSSNNLVDFFDCLIKYVQDGDSLPCKVVFLDEFQDISALQLQVIEKAFANAEQIYVAGDTEQCIFSYSGSRPDFLIDLSQRSEKINLSESYRIPRKVFDFAKAIVSFISEKTDKPFNFHNGNEEGNITQLADVERLKNFIDTEGLSDSGKCRWYLLSRNNCFLTRYTKVLEDNLIPYWNIDGFFMGGDIMTRLKDYEGFRCKGYKSEDKKRKFMEKFGIEDFDRPFTDTNLFTESRKWVYEAYIEHYGLEKLQEMCKWQPQILVSSVHQVKGGEAENVCVLLDNTAKTYGTIYDNIDEELRILYVAITRAKKNLFLVDSKNGNGYDRIVATLKDEFGLEW